jgi:uncharacterized protein YecE (DUF72 family)
MLGRPTGHSARPTLSPVRLRLGTAYFLEQVPPWIKVAVEFRHPSWHTEEVFSLLERSGATYCALERGAPSVYPACNGVIRLSAPPRPRGQQSLRWLLLR